MTAKIENERAPILMFTFARIFVFVKSRAVKTGKRPVVTRDMGGDPIDNDADARLVEGIDEELEIFRRAVAASGSIETGNLIAPGRVICVFGNGKKFDVRETHLFHVGNQ